MADYKHSECVELVETDCKHPNCSYRRKLTTGCVTEYCDYIGANWKAIGCPISKCDKYTTKPVKFPNEW